MASFRLQLNSYLALLIILLFSIDESAALDSDDAHDLCAGTMQGQIINIVDINGTKWEVRCNETIIIIPDPDPPGNDDLGGGWWGGGGGRQDGDGPGGSDPNDNQKACNKCNANAAKEVIAAKHYERDCLAAARKTAFRRCSGWLSGTPQKCNGKEYGEVSSSTHCSVILSIWPSMIGNPYDRFDELKVPRRFQERLCHIRFSDLCMAGCLKGISGSELSIPLSGMGLDATVISDSEIGFDSTCVQVANQKHNQAEMKRLSCLRQNACPDTSFNISTELTKKFLNDTAARYWFQEFSEQADISDRQKQILEKLFMDAKVHYETLSQDDLVLEDDGSGQPGLLLEEHTLETEDTGQPDVMLGRHVFLGTEDVLVEETTTENQERLTDAKTVLQLELILMFKGLKQLDVPQRQIFMDTWPGVGLVLGSGTFR